MCQYDNILYPKRNLRRTTVSLLAKINCLFALYTYIYFVVVMCLGASVLFYVYPSRYSMSHCMWQDIYFTSRRRYTTRILSAHRILTRPPNWVLHRIYQLYISISCDEGHVRCSDGLMMSRSHRHFFYSSLYVLYFTFIFETTKMWRSTQSRLTQKAFSI